MGRKKKEKKQPKAGIKYYNRKMPERSFLAQLKKTMRTYRDIYNAGVSDCFPELYDDVIGLIQEYERSKK